MAISVGTSAIQGDINNTGTIQVSAGAHATFFGDVVQNGTMQVATVGNTDGRDPRSLTGSGGLAGGGDVYALGDLRPGNSPGPRQARKNEVNAQQSFRPSIRQQNRDGQGAGAPEPRSAAGLSHFARARK